MTEVVYGEHNETHRMGWGEEGDPPAHRLLKERRERERLEDESFFSEIAQLCSFRGEETPMEALCRERFQFDGGWCFHAAEELLYGASLVHNQGSVGSCVGAGGGLALAAKASQEILNEGDPEDPFGWSTEDGSRDSDHAMPFTAYHYGAGRCKHLWDGEKFRGRNRGGDGSYCAVQIWAYKQIGVLPCSEATSNGPFPQSSDIRSWGNNAKGELNAHLATGQRYRMGNSVTVRSADDLKRTICELKQPCHICSNWGFRPKGGIDPKYGIQLYSRSGAWSHNMTLFGCIEIKGQWFVVVKNTWGADAHKEVGRGIPRGCFVVTLEEFGKWVRSSEVMSIGELTLPKSDMEFV